MHHPSSFSKIGKGFPPSLPRYLSDNSIHPALFLIVQITLDEFVASIKPVFDRFGNGLSDRSVQWSVTQRGDGAVTGPGRIVSRGLDQLQHLA